MGNVYNSRLWGETEYFNKTLAFNEKHTCLIKRLLLLFSFKKPRKILTNSGPKDEFKWRRKGLAQLGNHSRSHPGAGANRRAWKINHRWRSKEEMKEPSPAPAVSNINRKSFFDQGRSRPCCLLLLGCPSVPSPSPAVPGLHWEKMRWRFLD